MKKKPKPVKLVNLKFHQNSGRISYILRKISKYTYYLINLTMNVQISYQPNQILMQENS